MTAEKTPDPLKPGHITGQNPNTPERLPEHTADRNVRGRSQAQGNEEDLGGRPAFLFTSGNMSAVTLDSSGANLPPPPSGDWMLARYFTLGVRDAGLEDVRPEKIIQGVLAEGYFAWKAAPAGGKRRQ